MVCDVIMPVKKKRMPNKTAKKKKASKKRMPFSYRQIKRKLISRLCLGDKISSDLTKRLTEIVNRNIWDKKSPPTLKEITAINSRLKKMALLSSSLLDEATKYAQIFGKQNFESLVHELYFQVAKVRDLYKRVKSDFPKSGLVSMDGLNTTQKKIRKTP